MTGGGHPTLTDRSPPVCDSRIKSAAVLRMTPPDVVLTKSATNQID